MSNDRGTGRRARADKCKSKKHRERTGNLMFDQSGINTFVSLPVQQNSYLHGRWTLFSSTDVEICLNKSIADKKLV